MAEHGALAEAGRGGNHQQPGRERAVERLQQAFPIDQAGAQNRRAQFRFYEHVTTPCTLLSRSGGGTASNRRDSSGGRNRTFRRAAATKPATRRFCDFGMLADAP
ncbi:hypothetical protein DLREEDagr8_20630 [Dongia sp. agr-C8]